MNWARENRFLAGLLISLIAVLGIFGFLLWYFHAGYAETSDEFDKQATEYTRLRSLQPFPDTTNLAKMKEEEKSYFDEVDKLKRTLSAMTLPVEPMSPQDFQDKLRVSVSGIETRAKESRPAIILPAKFYLGFDSAAHNYQTQLPSAGASAALGRQLKVIELVLEELIDNKIDALLTIKRSVLPEETAGAAAKPVPGNKPGEKKGSKGITKYPIDLSFVVDQEKARAIINHLVGTNRQFFVIRLLSIQNQSLKGPAKGIATPPPTAPPTDAGATPPEKSEPLAPETPPVTPGATPLTMDAALGQKFTLGAEKIVVTMRIEVLDFPAPTGAVSPTPK